MRWLWKRSLLGFAGAALTLVAACSPGGAGEGSPSGDGPGVSTAGGLSRPDHVMVVVFENKDAADVLGSGDAPYLTSLAKSGATFTEAHGEAHPSQPNYLALFSGSTHGVTDDSCPQKLSGDNLASQLRADGQSFVGYSEDLPSPGYTGCRRGDYARKHNPWADFADLPASVNQPLRAMPTDYAKLPTVSFVIPNLCNDMHDCSVARGDTWAKKNLDRYASWAKEHNSLLIVTFDEDSGTPDNQIATIVAGAGVQVTTSDQPVDHYNLLRTLEDMYGLPSLGKAAEAEPFTGIWNAAER